MTTQPTTRNRYDDDDPMFAAPANPGTRRERPKFWWVGRDATETKFEVLCPGHQHRVGLILAPGDDGQEHLAYRLHKITTYSGWAFLCSNSLKFVCEVPVPNRREAVCPHTKKAARQAASS